MTGTQRDRLRIVVASGNPVKLRATERAFGKRFPDIRLEVTSVSVPSGVSEQPMSDAETRHGAETRAARARQSSPDADYWVGLEGGVEAHGNALIAFAWMAVRNRAGNTGTARSVTLTLPPAIKTLMDQGMELGDANDKVFATMNSKQAGGAFGLLTDGLYTREDVYTQTLVVALTPLVSSLYP